MTSPPFRSFLEQEPRVGVSAQRVGVDQLRGWSPTRYGSLGVTGGGAFWATSSPTTSSPRPPRR
jgi:Alpha/beta hydrolase domain